MRPPKARSVSAQSSQGSKRPTHPLPGSCSAVVCGAWSPTSLSSCRQVPQRAPQACTISQAALLSMKLEHLLSQTPAWARA